jgi:hypothetical protein
MPENKSKAIDGLVMDMSIDKKIRPLLALSFYKLVLSKYPSTITIINSSIDSH